MLKRHPEWPLRVYVVWEAVVRADAAGPPPGTYARIPDHRVRQFWDRELLLSQKMVQDLLAGSEHLPEEMEITPETVIWDVAAVYGPSAAWSDAMPLPDYHGYPVVDVAKELERHLTSRLGPRS